MPCCDNYMYFSLLPETIFWLQLLIKLITIDVKFCCLLSTKCQALSNSPILSHFIFSDAFPWYKSRKSRWRFMPFPGLQNPKFVIRALGARFNTLNFILELLKFAKFSTFWRRHAKTDGFAMWACTKHGCPQSGVGGFCPSPLEFEKNYVIFCRSTKYPNFFTTRRKCASF